MIVCAVKWRGAMDILKIAVLAVAGVLLALMIKQTKPEYSILISMAVCICIFIYLLSKLSTALSYIGQLEALVDIVNWQM